MLFSAIIFIGDQEHESIVAVCIYCLVMQASICPRQLKTHTLEIQDKIQSETNSEKKFF